MQIFIKTPYEYKISLRMTISFWTTISCIQIFMKTLVGILRMAVPFWNTISHMQIF